MWQFPSLIQWLVVAGISAGLFLVMVFFAFAFKGNSTPGDGYDGYY